jgi:hypothetical protein
MRMHDLAVYHEEGTGRMWTRAWLQNVGKYDAENSMVAIKLDFLPSPPNQSQRTFADSELRNMTPSKLRPVPDEKSTTETPNFYREYHPVPEAPGMNAYVWGEFRYKDFGDWDEPTKFCRYAEAKQVLNAKSARDGVEGGFSSPWKTCD